MAWACSATATLRHRYPPAEVRYVDRAVHCKDSQAAPPVEKTNADDRPEDDQTKKINHRYLVLPQRHKPAGQRGLGLVMPPHTLSPR